MDFWRFSVKLTPSVFPGIQYTLADPAEFSKPFLSSNEEFILRAAVQQN